jgi:hypothetical protein
MASERPEGQYKDPTTWFLPVFAVFLAESGQPSAVTFAYNFQSQKEF